MKTADLNEYLGRELGRNPYSEPIFRWDWSEDLYWPSYATGKSIEVTSPEGFVYFQPEYAKDRMSHKLHHQWVITKWYPPEDLENWQTNFPGAPYPARGYRIHTDWANKPNCAPTLVDTEILVKQIRQQRSMSFTDRHADMEAQDLRKEASIQREISDQIRDCIPAALNPFPGKRGGEVAWQTGVGESPVIRKETDASS